jgi:hypothetical protein
MVLRDRWDPEDNVEPWVLLFGWAFVLMNHECRL